MKLLIQKFNRSLFISKEYFWLFVTRPHTHWSSYLRCSDKTQRAEMLFNFFSIAANRKIFIPKPKLISDLEPKQGNCSQRKRKGCFEKSKKNCVAGNTNQITHQLTHLKKRRWTAQPQNFFNPCLHRGNYLMRCWLWSAFILVVFIWKKQKAYFLLWRNNHFGLQ